MRSYRRLTVLGVFVAVGVGLAISLGTSTAPSKTDHLAGSFASSDSFAPEQPILPAASRAHAAKDASTDHPGHGPIQILPPPTPNRPIVGAVAGGASPSAVATRPLHAEAYPALAEDQDGSTPKTVVTEAMLKALLGQNKSSDQAESIPPPPPLPTPPSPLAPPPEIKQPDTPRRNTIRRTGGTPGDRFVINILDADIREVLDLLSKEGSLNILASPKVKGKVSAALNDVGLESALDAILRSTGYVARREGRFLFVGTPDDFVQMAHTTDEIRTRIYHPSYVTSAELKNLIEPVLTEGVGVISVTSESDSGIPADINDGGGDNYAGGDALLVRDYEAVLREVDQLVAEVDLRPLQVHIEAMILSVKLNDEYKFGVNFQLLRQFDHMKFGWGNIPKVLTDVKFDGGLKFGYLDESLGAFINALETVGDTNVIATPRLMVVNKHAAVIQIGKQKGYVNQTTQTETAATQSVEMLELGTILRIRPFISNDGMIRLEVHPEISDGNVVEKGTYVLPEKEITQVTTNIMVRDGCTAVIGGLIQDEQHVTRSQIPLLGSLPVVGIAFRDKDEKIDRRELIVLITPNVVREQEAYREGAVQACEFQRRQATYAEKMSPIGKRSLARKYVRRAQTAWAQGDRRKALRMAELAVHFDPLNRQAIELRSDIWLGKPTGPPSVVPPEAMHPAGALDGPQLAPWVLNQLGNPMPSGDPAQASGPGTINPQPMPNTMSTPDGPSLSPDTTELNPDPPGTLTVLPAPARHQ